MKMCIPKTKLRFFLYLQRRLFNLLVNGARFEATAVFFFFLGCLSFGSTLAAEPIHGVKLPIVPGNNTLTIAGVDVKKARVYGCSTLLNPLLNGSSFAYGNNVPVIADKSCVALLSARYELSDVPATNLIDPPQRLAALPCNRAVIFVEPHDFVEIYAVLGGGGPILPTDTQSEPPNGGNTGNSSAASSGYLDTKECKLTGQVCVTETSASFSLGCQGIGEIEISTEGEIKVTKSAGPFSAAISLP